MRRTSRVFVNPRPTLVIERMKTIERSNCRSVSCHKITSRSPLTVDALRSLRLAGLLGFGQDSRYRYLRPDGTKVRVDDAVNWNIEPSGTDTVACCEVDDLTGEIIRTPSINPYSGKVDQSIQEGYYVYEVETTCDSSD